jgi:hypothetical protein
MGKLSMDSAIFIAREDAIEVGAIWPESGTGFSRRLGETRDDDDSARDFVEVEVICQVTCGKLPFVLIAMVTSKNKNRWPVAILIFDDWDHIGSPTAVICGVANS